MQELFYSGNKRKIRVEDIIASISNLPKSKFEELVLGYFIYFDTNLYFDSQDSIHIDLFSNENKLIYEKFIGFINSINRKIEKINKIDFFKLFSEHEKEYIKLAEDIYDETLLNLQETSITPQVDIFLNYLADLEAAYRERKVIGETIKFVQLLSDPKRKQQRIEKKELALAEQLNQMEKVIHSKNDKYPLLGSEELEQITNDLSDPNKALKPIETQFVSLDKTGNIFPGQLIIIAGRPGMGKTSFALNLFDYFLRTNQNTIYFSMEMPKEQMTHKMMSLSLKIDTKEYINKDNGILDLPKDLRERWSEELKTSYKNITLVDKPGISLSEIKKYIIQRNYLGRIKAENDYLAEHQLEDRNLIPDYIRNKNDIKVIFIDYLQIMNLTSSNPRVQTHEKISEITTSLKKMSIEYNFAIILLSQLNRDSQQGTDKRPTMAQLKGSGSIEQDADKIYLLHREDYYLNRDVKIDKSLREAVSGIAELIIDKQRGGLTDTVYLEWEGKYQIFSNLSSKKVDTGEVDENNNPIYKEYSPTERINEYKELSRTIEELNKGNYNSQTQPTQQQKDIAEKLGNALQQNKEKTSRSAW